MELKIKYGLIYRVDYSVSVGTADEIANANGFVAAEQFVSHYDGFKVTLGDDLKVLAKESLWLQPPESQL
jgi:hypothetical protein